MPTEYELWLATLRDLADRNLAVGLTPVPVSKAVDATLPETLRAKDSDPTYRARLLGLRRDESLVVQMPAGETAKQGFIAGMMVQVVAVGPRQRLVGRCTVGGQAELRLNGAVAVSALHLSKASEVYSAQRRNQFRADTRGEGVTVTLFDPLKPDAQAQIDAQTLDISGGGAKLAVRRVAGDAVDLLREGVYGCKITLPDSPQPLFTQAHLVHIDRSRDGTFYLGLRFDFEGERQKQRIQDRIHRFAAAIERKQLQSQRGRRSARG